MRPILMDTNAYSAFKLGEKSIVEVVQHGEILVVSPIVLGELLAGFKCGTKEAKNRTELQSFLSSSRVKIFPISFDTGNFYSHIYALLKTKGKPIPSNDLWIAAQALEHGCVLCTNDKHFQEIDGLIIGSSITELMI